MKVVLFANTDWYLWNFRRTLALALRDAGHEVLLVSPLVSLKLLASTVSTSKKRLFSRPQPLVI